MGELIAIQPRQGTVDLLLLQRELSGFVCQRTGVQ